MPRIESLLSGRLFLAPQVFENRVYFISNLSGHLSLYAMNYGGSVPEPLLPPNIALQNPHLAGKMFQVFPRLSKILVMVDRDGDENYQPMLIPLEGGLPEPAFKGFFAEFRSHLGQCDTERNLFYIGAESRKEQMITSYQANLATGELIKLGASPWGCVVDAISEDHTRIILIDGYEVGDNVLYLWEAAAGERRLFYGQPLEERQPGHKIQLNSLGNNHFCSKGLLCGTSLFSDTFGLGFIFFHEPEKVHPVKIQGLAHQGLGEFNGLTHLQENRYLLDYNIDGCSWLYEASFDESRLVMNVKYVICGTGAIGNGVLESCTYDRDGDRLALSYSTATSPTQIYTVEGRKRQQVIRHTNERLVGLPEDQLSLGEDASFISHDGLRVSARLYLPAPSLGFKGPLPLVYYIHGGPQGQERPDFAWFSMPLIQFLTLNGFAVFVPNVRGSTGYGLNYTKQVDRDWGGQDRLDHVFAMTQILPKDKRLDVKRAGVVGRSYGGYMTLTLAGRHPELWSAAVDMFGPYDLITFLERIPETWKPYFSIVLGDPNKEEDRSFLTERSPRSYLHQLACPMLVIQGKNDPRVVERESADVVSQLRQQGKQIEYLMFENEGHDVLKYENRVTCYNAITDFFAGTLKHGS